LSNIFSLHTDFFKVAQMAQLRCCTILLFCQCVTPTGLIYSEIDSVIPDVVWVSNNRLAQIEDDSGHLTASPELVVEVLSSGKENERRDKETKLKLYSIQGVQEYWIIDRFKKQVEIYRREQNQLTLTTTLMAQDEIYSILLPDFTCRVSFILGDK